eukprot:TRINITY_DN8106_c0_g1_i1.p4 TRINITY_DN8106_c0_g1~~TRINITY_DN8106_c0_g1_i1.p4  ORF type:complete len:102 (+),score=14.14 TRINITY_DN8106_c0_g1_i1:355-660(+)
MLYRGKANNGTQYLFEYTNPLSTTTEMYSLYIYMGVKSQKIEKVEIRLFYNVVASTLYVKKNIVFEHFPKRYFDLGVKCHPADPEVEDNFWKIFEEILKIL